MRGPEVLVELLTVHIDGAVGTELALGPDEFLEELARVVVLEENFSFIAVWQLCQVFRKLSVLFLRHKELDAFLSADDTDDVLLFSAHLEVAPRADDGVPAFADPEKLGFL